MAATPSAEWGRLKWRRCNDVRRRAHAQLGAGRFGLRLRGGRGFSRGPRPRGRGGGGAGPCGWGSQAPRATRRRWAALGPRAVSLRVENVRASSRACPPPKRKQPVEKFFARNLHRSLPRHWAGRQAAFGEPRSAAPPSRPPTPGSGLGARRCRPPRSPLHAPPRFGLIIVKS